MTDIIIRGASRPDDGTRRCRYFSPEVVELLAALAEERQNRLSTAEYDQTTWSARTWTSFTVQKLSVALHRAVAMEIGLALGLSVATDPRA